MESRLLASIPNKAKIKGVIASDQVRFTSAVNNALSQPSASFNCALDRTNVEHISAMIHNLLEADSALNRTYTQLSNDSLCR